VAERIPILVGITTLPSRIGLMRPVLDSLLNGNLVPDKIYVSVPELSLREKTGYVIPDFFHEDAIAKKVEIIRLDQDYGSGTKLLGLLGRIEKPSYVVLADDDVAYKRFFLRRLIEHQRSDHQSSFTFYAYLLGGLRVGQGVDGLSFWSANLDGVRDFYQRYIAGTDLMFHDDLWISFYLMTRRVMVKNLAPLLEGGEAKDILHAVNALTAETGPLARQRLNVLVTPLFNQVNVPRDILHRFLTGNRDDLCLCGSGRNYLDCHGAAVS
jgi:hypothetical protein